MFPSNRLFCWAFIQIVGGEIYTSNEKWYVLVNSDLYTEAGAVINQEVELAYQINPDAHIPQLQEQLEKEAQNENDEVSVLIQDYFDLSEYLFEEHQEEKKKRIVDGISSKHEFWAPKQVKDNEFLTTDHEKKPTLLLVYSENDINFTPEQFFETCRQLEEKQIIPKISQMNKILYHQKEVFVYVAYEKPKSLMSLSSLNFSKLPAKTKEILKDALNKFEQTLHQEKMTVFVPGNQEYTPTKEIFFFNRTDKNILLKAPFLNPLNPNNSVSTQSLSNALLECN